MRSLGRSEGGSGPGLSGGACAEAASFAARAHACASRIYRSRAPQKARKTDKRKNLNPNSISSAPFFCFVSKSETKTKAEAVFSLLVEHIPLCAALRSHSQEPAGPADACCFLLRSPGNASQRGRDE